MKRKPTRAQVRAAKYVQRLHEEIDDASGIPAYCFGGATVKPTAVASLWRNPKTGLWYHVVPRVRISQAALRRAKRNPNEVAFSDKNAFNSWIDEAPRSDKDYKKMMRRCTSMFAKKQAENNEWLRKHPIVPATKPTAKVKR